MKKFVFIVPLMAVSLLASCGGGSKDPIKHTLKFEGTHCEMHDADGKTVLQKQFEAGQTASFFLVGASEEFEIPKETNVKLTITGTDDPFDGIFSYNEADGSLSVKMTADITVSATSNALDPYKVTEQEFNDACSFKDISYLQLNYYDDEKLVVKEMSPKVYHYVSSSEEINSYSETYVGKNNDGTYDEYYRYSKTRLFSLRKNVSEDAFITPQSDDVNILSQINNLGLSYNSFTYNKEIESYTASTTSGTINLTLKFNNKKVTSYAIKTNENENYSTEFIYSYEEKTPKLPDKTARWYDHEDWWNYCSNGDFVEQANEKDIKKEVKLTVNGVEHKVRLIDVDKDVDANGNIIHCTFEFSNLLSDSYGYSLATQWNDTDDIDWATGSANHDYLNSSIRKALTGEGNGHILWAQKGATAWSLQDDNPYKDKSALEMIEESNSTFVNKLIAPKKSVSCFNKNTNAWEEKEIVNNKNEYDKIFLLSPKEVGSESSREGAYTYYSETDEREILSLRIKKQVKENDPGMECLITDHQGQTFPNDVENYAGFNLDEDGGHAYLREPDRGSHRTAYNIWFSGGIAPDDCCYYAYSLAPAFCI